jgi:hypothetical protein
MPLITISQSIGSDGKNIAGLVAEQLSYELSDDINTCSMNALEAMEKLSLKKQIYAELLKNNIEIHSSHVEVAENADVHITGISRSLENIEKIKHVMKNIPNITAITYDLPVVTGTI